MYSYRQYDLIMLIICTYFIIIILFNNISTLFVFKNNNILILYDYRYYCDFKIVFNLFIQTCPYLVPISEYGQCPLDTLYYNTGTLYTTR